MGRLSDRYGLFRQEGQGKGKVPLDLCQEVQAGNGFHDELFLCADSVHDNIGVLFDIFALILFISVLAEFFSSGVPITGWSSLMCVILLSSGLILSMLGVLGEYLWRTLDASRTRPPFIIDEHQAPEKQEKEEA